MIRITNPNSELTSRISIEYEIKNITDTLLNNALSEFPEFYSYKNVKIYDNGNIEFNNSDSDKVYYFISSNTGKINDINSDYTPLNSYTDENNPVGIRHVHYENGKFTTRSAYEFNGTYYKLIDVDNIDNHVLNENGYFTSTNNSLTFDSLKYLSKTSFLFRFSSAVSSGSANINGTTVPGTKDGNNIYFDLSNYLDTSEEFKKYVDFTFTGLRNGNVEII